MTADQVVLNLALGRISIPELEEPILSVFAAEIEAEVRRGSPVDKGYLRERWTVQWPIRDHKIEIGNNTFYLPWHIRGTGIYGPHKTMICARGLRRTSRYDAPDPSWPRALAFKSKGKLMIRRCIRGMKPNSFFQDGVETGVDNAVIALQAMVERGGL